MFARAFSEAEPNPDVRELIRRMSAANPGWGAPRIHGELGKLSIKVPETTVVPTKNLVPAEPIALGAIHQ